MIRRVIELALSNPLIVLLFALVLAAGGAYAFVNVNVEAYPDPAPAIIEVVAQFPGASAEEVERQVSVPLEVTMAGMPNLTMLRSKSLFGLSHLRMQFEYGYEFDKARQEVINRLQFTQPLPPGVAPQISPQSPTGEIYRYTLNVPKDRYGNDLYTLNDIKALQDWVLEREFRRVPRIIDVTSSGGTVKRYEIHPDPDRMRRYGVTLQQLQQALQNSNTNASGDIMVKGAAIVNTRTIGLIGGGEDPATAVLGLSDPFRAAALLREAENRRVAEIRDVVVTSYNNVPVTIGDLVDGGPVRAGEPLGVRGVVVGHQTRMGQVSLSKPVESASGREVWRDEPDKVQCIVLMRKGEDTLPALKSVRAKVAELNDPASGRMLPGVKIETYYDRGELINVTTETVHENLITGLVLVTVILLMFLSNVRTALIVAINIPLALLFAFAALYFRGKSANLLSIGAVDFGIIVDSSVIMVENIYRHISAGEDSHLPLKERILNSSSEITKALFFSTCIMVCAFLPLFTMTGPEGQLFGPMAETYAFALGGALCLALTLSPVLCLLWFGGFDNPVTRWVGRVWPWLHRQLFAPIGASEDNFMVRWLKDSYLRQLDRCMRYRWLTLLFMGALVVGTGFLLPLVGREFMPQLEEGNLWITATFPLNVSMNRVAGDIDRARGIMANYREVEVLVPAIGRPDDGTDPTGYYRVEIFAPLRPHDDWPNAMPRGTRLEEYQAKGGKFLPRQWWYALLDRGERLLFGPTRPRTKDELVDQMNRELRAQIVGVDWNFSQYIRDNVTEAMSGVKGDNAVKIFGPDLNKLELLADQVKNKLTDIPGVQEVAVFNIMGQTNLEFRIDLKKCKKWGVTAADVNNVLQTAVGGAAASKMIEGEKQFDITLRMARPLRGSETAILDLPLNITNNQLVIGPGTGPAPTGTSMPPPPSVGSQTSTTNPYTTNVPQLRLRELVSPVGEGGAPDPRGSWERPAASTVYREQGKRFIAVKFNVRGRDLAGAVADAKAAVAPIVKAPYHTEWTGEFQEMEQAEARLFIIVPTSMVLIFILLYLAFRSVLDSVLVLLNVVALSLGGIWALLITDTNFSISAAVGFVSIFGVAIMDGLLLIASFNLHRAHGMSMHDAIMEGASRRVRAVTMTALTAILGLLPAALSTRIGAQTQRPLAIVVVGGMITTLLLTRYLMPVMYSFYGHREVSAESASMAH